MLFSRHPAMKYWPSDHGWHIYEIIINEGGIGLIDYFGGIATIPKADYFEATI